MKLINDERITTPGAAQEDCNPFHEHRARLDALHELKRAVVRLGLRGDRQSFKLARRLFEDVPGMGTA